MIVIATASGGCVVGGGGEWMIGGEHVGGLHCYCSLGVFADAIIESMLFVA